MVAPQPPLNPFLPLRRRAILNLVLALLVAGLAMFVTLSPPGKKGEPELTLVPVPPGDIRSIQIERAGKPKLQFAREGDRWYLRDPVVAPANPRRIQDLLAVPALPVTARFEVKHLDLARFGLEPPLVTLRLNDDTFEFGETEPLDGKRYVHYHKQVQLVPDTVYLQLTQSPGFFIDTRLLEKGLRPVRISAPRRVVWLQDGAWWSDPAPAAGEPPAAAVARAWETAQALTVHVGADAGGGQRITLNFARGFSIEFDFAEQDGNPVLVRRDLNLQYYLDPGQAGQLMLMPGAGRDGQDPAAH